MDWINGISVILGAIGGISGVSALLYYKPRKKIEDLSVSNKQIDISNEAMKALNEVYKQLNENLIEISKLRASDGELWEIVRLQTRVLEKQINRKEYAESHLCKVINCKLREPSFGTYKTSNSDEEMMQVMDRIRKLQGDKSDVKEEKSDVKEEKQ